MAFTHLHAHTEYSLMDSCNRIHDYVSRVKELGMDSAAMTDHGNMYGAIEFYEECDKAGIRAVIGCEVYVATGSRWDKGSQRGTMTDKGSQRGAKDYYHLVLLAENDTGYANLMKLVSRGFTEGFYKKPRIDRELMERYHEGLIVLSGCVQGEVSVALIEGDHDRAVKAAQWHEACFGKGNYYLEIQDHGLKDQKTVIEGMKKLSEETGIPLVATNDVHYTLETDAEVHDHLLCIGYNKTIHDTDRMKYEGTQFYVKSEEEMRSLFSEIPEALENAHRIAERCIVKPEFGNYHIPEYVSPDGASSWEAINRICEEGLKERYPEDDGKVRERLKYELEMIRQMGFVDYFLIVWDFINHARSVGIPVGPGRGSGAGSVAAYCMHITNIDPIRYNLIFERFLNPERVSMPDFDVDISDERRQEVIEYVQHKYGADRTAKIIAFDTFKAKRAIHDVARVRGWALDRAGLLAGLIPEGQDMTLAKALDENPELKAQYDRDEETHHLLDICFRLEGAARNKTKHAAGILIAPQPVGEFVPLCLDDKAIMTQYTAPTIEHLGLLKMDMLGLKTLSVINNAARAAKERRGLSFDPDHMDYSDKAVFKMIADGHTDGVFQLESAGMTGFMKQLGPRNLEELIAGISLYRPGPRVFIPKYLEGKASPEKVTYACEQLKPILKNTYGCIVYQEQVMQIVRDLAGFSMGQADQVRRSMSKKKTKDMEADRIRFVDGDKAAGIPGCVANGIPRETAEELYDRLMDFASYAFNKSHAAAYAVVAYQTAYLKTYAPAEYMAALMTSEMKNHTKVARYTYACREMHIPVLPPDVNEGESGFSATDEGVRYGMAAIKGVGPGLIDEITRERSQNGRFTDLSDLIKRVPGNVLNKRALESLIKAGALQSFGTKRSQLLAVYESALTESATEKKNSIPGQMSLFDMMGPAEQKITLPDIPELPLEECLAYEYDLCGAYISGHPLDAYIDVIKEKTTHMPGDFLPDEEADETGEQTGAVTYQVSVGEAVTVAGILRDVKVLTTKKGDLMAFAQLEDMIGRVPVTIFPRTYGEYREELVDGKRLLIEGKTQLRSTMEIIADKIEKLE